MLWIVKIMMYQMTIKRLEVLRRCFKIFYHQTQKALNKKSKFSIKDFFSKCGHIYWRNLNGKLHFLCSKGNNFPWTKLSSKLTTIPEISLNEHVTVTNMMTISKWSYSYDQVIELGLLSGKCMDINYVKYFKTFIIYVDSPRDDISCNLGCFLLNFDYLHQS